MAKPDVNSDFSLEGKGAVVVGAEFAIGGAAARVLAEAGANVMLASQSKQNEQLLNQAARAVNVPGRKIVTGLQDATVREQVRTTMDMATAALGGIDILVNAIDAPHYAPVGEIDDAAYEQVFRNNFRPVWLSCQEAGSRMIAGRGGVIVNITSVIAERGVPNASLYCAAKAAVLNLTRALAIEWARNGVRVNALEAGWVDEDRSPAKKDDEFRKNLLKYLPYNRLVKPEELGGALLYLVSPAAGFVTGESIAVDGGLLCRV